jgi:hypothetical protein
MTATKELSKTLENGRPQCQWVTDKGRQCKLENGHKMLDQTPHGHMTVIRKQEKVKLASVMPNGTKLKAKKVAPGVKIPKVTNRKSSFVRDEDQKNIDKDASAVYAAWLTTKPKEWDNWPKVQYEVPKQVVDTLLEYIRATVNSGGPCAGKLMRYRKGIADSGDVLITWGIGDSGA